MNFYSFFKMMQRKKYTVASPENPKAVSFFNHFPSNFLRPYGLASEAPDSDAIIRRTNPKSCEWLLRPAIAMSEFAQTLVENMEFLKTTDSKFVRSKRMKEAVDNMQPFLNCLQKGHECQPRTTTKVTTPSRPRAPLPLPTVAKEKERGKGKQKPQNSHKNRQ